MDTNEYTLDGPDDVLAARIRSYRLNHQMTQAQLAAQLDVTQQTVARWEQGSPPRRYMHRIIESLLDESERRGSIDGSRRDHRYSPSGTDTCPDP